MDARRPSAWPRSARRFGRPVMKAVGIAEPADLDGARPPMPAAPTASCSTPSRPARANALPGGNGLAFDWRLLAGLDPKLSFMLSGGLTPDNVAEAIRLTGSQAVDVSSGVESGPGLKDPAQDRGLRQGRPGSIRRCRSRTSGCVPLPGRALRSSRQDRPCQLKPNPIPSAPAPTSAGISASSAAASSPRP